MPATPVLPKFKVRRSGIHGRGVFAARPLRKGTLIGAYAGRRWSAEEQQHHTWDHGVTYVFGLSDGSLIDGAEGGNATRFLNHCCAPNCQATELTGRDGLLAIRIHTLRAVPMGAELFIDYSLIVDDPEPALYPCHCGVPTCRGTLLAPHAS